MIADCLLMRDRPWLRIAHRQTVRRGEVTDITGQTADNTIATVRVVHWIVRRPIRIRCHASPVGDGPGLPYKCYEASSEGLRESCSRTRLTP